MICNTSLCIGEEVPRFLLGSKEAKSLLADTSSLFIDSQKGISNLYATASSRELVLTDFQTTEMTYFSQTRLKLYNAQQYTILKCAALSKKRQEARDTFRAFREKTKGKGKKGTWRRRKKTLFIWESVWRVWIAMHSQSKANLGAVLKNT